MVSGFTMDRQPSVLLFDLYGNPALTVYEASQPDGDIKVVVSLSGFGLDGKDDSQLMGTTLLPPYLGTVQFTDLAVQGMTSEGYRLIFQIDPARNLLVQSAAFAVRNFTRMELTMSPQNPSFVDRMIRASIRAADDQGRLAPLSGQRCVVIVSLELPATSFSPAKLLGAVEAQVKDGLATFSGAFINATIMEEPGAKLRFKTTWPESAEYTIQDLLSDAFLVVSGPYNEFAIEVNTPEFYVAYRQFDNAVSECPNGFVERGDEMVQGCGPSVRLRTARGELSQQGSALVHVIQCKECDTPLAKGCTCGLHLFRALDPLGAAASHFQLLGH
jgi:hypothetical protein